MDITWLINMFNYFIKHFSTNKKNTTNSIEINNSTVIFIGEPRKKSN